MEERKDLVGWALGDQELFIRHGWHEFEQGHVETLVFLIQQNAIGTSYGHDFLRDKATIGYPRGRIAFEDAAGVPAPQGGSFASAVAIFTRNQLHLDGLVEAMKPGPQSSWPTAHPVWWIHRPSPAWLRSAPNV